MDCADIGGWIILTYKGILLFLGYMALRRDIEFVSGNTLLHSIGLKDVSVEGTPASLAVSRHHNTETPLVLVELTHNAGVHVSGSLSLQGKLDLLGSTVALSSLPSGRNEVSTSTDPADIVYPRGTVISAFSPGDGKGSTTPLMQSIVQLYVANNRVDSRDLTGTSVTVPGVWRFVGHGLYCRQL